MEELQDLDLALGLGGLGRRHQLVAHGLGQGRQAHATENRQRGKLFEDVTTLHYAYS